MFIFNITINIQEDVQKQWLQWMKEDYIAEMLLTRKFSKVLMSKVLVDEPLGGVSYSVQFTAEKKEDMESFKKEESDYFMEKLKKWDGKFVAFPTELEVVYQN